MAAIAACQGKQETNEPEYIVQVSLGGWHSPAYTAEQIIGRLDTVSNIIPVKKVIIGWSLEKEIYRKVGEFLHSKDIKMLFWLLFMDRIRTQSFVSGVSGVLNCGCELCAEKFKAEGIDLDVIKAEWEAKGDKFLSVTGYTPADGFSFENPVAEAFFKAKGHIVSRDIHRLR
jgi:hypothetical protein